MTRLALRAVAASWLALAGAQATAQTPLAPWGQYQGDVQHTGRSPLPGPDVPVLPLFTIPGPLGTASPSVGAGGTVYFVGEASRSLHAVAPGGAERWRTFLGTDGGGVPAIGPDGTVHVAGRNGTIFAVEPAQGAIRWTFQVVPSGIYAGAINGGPVVGPDGTLYVATLAGDVYAISGAGQEVWRARLALHQGVSSLFWLVTPALDPARGRVYVQSNDTGLIGFGGFLFALDAATGAVVWSLPLNGQELATPTVGDDGTVYAWGFDGTGSFLFAFGPDGVERWRWEGAVPSSVALSPDGTKVHFLGNPVVNGFFAGPHVVTLRALDGVEVWRTQVMSSGNILTSAPAVGATGTIYVGLANGESTTENSVVAVSADGAILWRFRTGGVVWTAPAIGPDATLYTGADALYALVDRQLVNRPPVARPAGPARTVVGDITQLDGSASSDPDGDRLSFAWSIGAQPPGAAGQIFGATQRFPSLLADVPGDYGVDLVVSDGDLFSAPARITVTAISTQACALERIAAARALVAGGAAVDFADAKSRDAMLKALDTAASSVRALRRDRAVQQLQSAASRTDGCPLRGAPDLVKPIDWIVGCPLATQVYGGIQSSIGCASRI